MNWWVSKIFYCSGTFLLWTALFTIQSLAGTWKPLWYEVISCAKESDLFISIWGNSWNVLSSFSLPSPSCYISLSDFFSSFKFQFPHCLFCRLPHWNYSFLRIVHSILLLFLLASSFVLFSWISVYVLPMSDGWGRAWCLLQVYLIYIKQIIEVSLL